MPESLSTITEFGVGLAGFSSVVVALGYRDQRLGSLDRARVTGLLFGSLGAALFATLPLVLSDSGLTSVQVWRVSSVAFAIGLAGFLAFAIAARRSLSAADRAVLHPGLWVFVLGGILACIPLLVWNSLALMSAPSSGPYLSALYFLLVYSSVQFFRVLLARPPESPAA